MRYPYAQGVQTGSHPTGNATPSDVLDGVTFSSAQLPSATGTIPIVAGGNTVVPGTVSTVAIPGGSYAQDNISVAGSASLTASNIADGVSIFGVTGTALTATGNATAEDILSGVTASSDNGSLTGTIPTVAGGTTITPTTAAQTAIAAGTYTEAAIAVAGSADLVAANIVSGASIFGVAGTSIPTTHGSALLTSSGTWTVPANVTQFTAFIVGGGGGGGGGSNYSGVYGGGGATGCVSVTTYSSVAAGQSFSYTIGAGGSGGASGSTPGNGSDGSSTTFDSITVPGGGGGDAASGQVGGVGGYVSTPSTQGQINFAGNPGANLDGGTFSSSALGSYGGGGEGGYLDEVYVPGQNGGNGCVYVVW